MSNVTLPSSWHTISKEGEKYYESLAQKTLADFENNPSPDHLYFFMRSNRKFVLSDAGGEADAGTKETQNTVIDFLDELNQELPREEQISIVDLYHTFF